MITNQQRRRFAALLLFMSFFLVSGAQAEDGTPLPSAGTISTEQSTAAVQPETQKTLPNYVEGGGSYMDLSNGFGYWAGGYSRAVFTAGNNTWNAEVNGQHEFGDAGVYLAAGDTHTFNPSWYGSLTVGSSIGGFFWPRFRTDGFINKKWLGRKQWITTLGYGYYEAKDVHRNQYIFLGSTYYFEKPWIVEEGMYFNISNPGAVFAPSGFAAVTRGRNKRQYITVRAGFGEEAYQLIGPASTLTNFQSQTLTITWRKWVGRSWGFNFVGDFYHNPFYTRGGSSFGFFKDF